MSHEVTLNGSLISAGLELATAVGIALEQSARDYPRRLIRVHGIDGETVLVEVRDGELVSLAPGVVVTQEGAPNHGPRAQVGTVVEPDADMRAFAAALTVKQRAALVCVRWHENDVEKETLLWSAVAQLHVIGFEQSVSA